MILSLVSNLHNNLISDIDQCIAWALIDLRIFPAAIPVQGKVAVKSTPILERNRDSQVP